MSGVFSKIIVIMLVLAVFVTVFGISSKYDFFGSFADSFEVVSGFADRVSSVIGTIFMPDNDEPLDEFYLLRLWFGDNNEYYVDLALPDTNVRQKGRDDYYYLSSNYPAEDVYIVEFDIIHELKVCSKNPDGVLLDYWGLKRMPVLFMTKEEYYADYYADSSKLLPS